jgi:hypothetical protein
MATAQGDQVVQIRQPTIGPMLQVMDVGELAIGTAGHPTSLVPSGDLDPLCRRRIPTSPSLVEDVPLRTLDREGHPRITRQAPGNLSSHRTNTFEFGRSAVDTQQQTERRVKDEPGTNRTTATTDAVAAGCTIASVTASGTTRSTTRSTTEATASRPMEQLDQDVVEPLVIRHIRPVGAPY